MGCKIQYWKNILLCIFECGKLTEPEVLNPDMYRISREGREFLMLKQYMCLEADMSPIGIFVLAMEVKEIIIAVS